MCESGIEGIQFKIAKKSSSKESDLKEFEDSGDKTATHSEQELTSSTSKDTFTGDLDSTYY